VFREETPPPRPHVCHQARGKSRGCPSKEEEWKDLVLGRDLSEGRIFVLPTGREHGEDGGGRRPTESGVFLKIYDPKIYKTTPNSDRDY
jgi:hypothetical protein